MLAALPFNYCVRSLDPEEWETYQNMTWEMFDSANPAFTREGRRNSLEMSPSLWQSDLRDPHRGDFVFEKGNEAVGMCSVVQGNGHAHFCGLYVRKGHRGFGLSDVGFDARKSWARQQGFAYAVLSHRADNVAAVRVFERNGFSDAEMHEAIRWADGRYAPMVVRKLKL